MQDLQQFLTACTLVGAIVLFVVNVCVALAIAADATERRSRELPVAFFGPPLWFFVTILGSLLAVALYWVIHYSNLRRPDEFPGR